MWYVPDNTRMSVRSRLGGAQLNTPTEASVQEMIMAKKAKKKAKKKTAKKAKKKTARK